jgi:alpha-L-fucosidase
VKLGLYYSNPDWHHPNALNPKSSHQMPAQPGDSPDMDKYEEYVKAQVTELLTNYGEIVCFFWDISTKICRPEMDALVRRLQPGIMINDRGWENKTTCDYSTPERDWKWDVPSGKHVEA